jgi:uncharacterized protein
MRKRVLFLPPGCWPALLLMLVIGSAVAQQPVPALNSRVTDLTGTLSTGQQAGLEQQLAQFETGKGSQIAVLVVPTTAPETIEQYALKVAETWKLGRADADDGVLLLVAKDDRKLRIEVGYGLEGAIPDATANRIVEEIIVPYFKQSDYYAGIKAGVDRIIGLIEGEPLPPPASDWSRQNDGIGGLAALLPLAFFAFPILPVLGKQFGRLPVAVGSSVIMGGLGYLLIGIIGALALGLFAFVIALNAGTVMQPATGLPRRGGYRQGPVFYPGGSGRSSGSGGGGFSGGGGGFGGGGASGSW